MRKTAGIAEIFLQPGELYFGGRHTRIRTLLCSCVSQVSWRPELLVGGMRHLILPLGDIPTAILANMAGRSKA